MTKEEAAELDWLRHFHSKIRNAPYVGESLLGYRFELHTVNQLAPARPSKPFVPDRDRKKGRA